MKKFFFPFHSHRSLAPKVPSSRWYKSRLWASKNNKKTWNCAVKEVWIHIHQHLDVSSELAEKKNTLSVKIKIKSAVLCWRELWCQIFVQSSRELPTATLFLCRQSNSNFQFIIYEFYTHFSSLSHTLSQSNELWPSTLRSTPFEAHQLPQFAHFCKLIESKNYNPWIICCSIHAIAIFSSFFPINLT